MRIKSVLFMSIALAAQLCFADTHISGFAGVSSSQGDAFIRGEFAAEIQKASASDIKSGKFFLRQKFQDAFEDGKVSYNLFVGVPQPDANRLVRFDLPSGTSLSQVIQERLYNTDNPATDDIDIEKIYTDGTSLYTEYGDVIYYKKGDNFIAINKSTQTTSLVAGASAPVVAATTTPNTTNNIADASLGNIKTSVETQTKADKVANDIDNRFGYGSEIKTWSGWSLIGLGAAAIGGSVWYFTQAQKSQKSIDATTAFINNGTYSDGTSAYDPTIGIKGNADSTFVHSYQIAAQAQLTHDKNIKSDQTTVCALLGVLGIGAVSGGVVLLTF